MQDLSLLGNAAAIPIIIAATQFLKRNFYFKRKSEVVSLFVSFIVCFGWEFYYSSQQELLLWWGSGIISTVQHTIRLVMVSCATWLSATKSYDFIIGEKKKQRQIEETLQEKELLKKRLEEFQKLEGGSINDLNSELDEKIRTLLERG